MTIEQLKEEIDAEVNTNGQRLITGAKMNKVLKDTVDTLDAEVQEVDSKTVNIPYVFATGSRTALSDEDIQSIEQAIADKKDVHFRFTSAIDQNNMLDAKYVGNDRIIINNVSSVVYVFSTAPMLKYSNGTTPSLFFYVVQVVESTTPHNVIFRKVTLNDFSATIIP